MFLKVKNLEKYYDKKLPLIRRLNFSVKKGEIISFIGESGSGNRAGWEPKYYRQ